MIATLMSLLGLAGWGSGIVGALGLGVKLLKLLGVGGALVANPASAALERVWELVAWAIKGVLTYVGTRAAGAVDHIFSNGFAGALVIASLVVAYEAGVGRRDPEPPRPTAAAPGPKPSPTKPARDERPPGPFDWLESVIR